MKEQYNTIYDKACGVKDVNPIETHSSIWDKLRDLSDSIDVNSELVKILSEKTSPIREILPCCGVEKDIGVSCSGVAIIDNIEDKLSRIYKANKELEYIISTIRL
jgi:hypothetical protein